MRGVNSHAFHTAPCNILCIGVARYLSVGGRELGVPMYRAS